MRNAQLTCAETVRQLKLHQQNPVDVYIMPLLRTQERRTGITQHALNLVATACKEGGLLDEAMRWVLQRHFLICPQI